MKKTADWNIYHFSQQAIDADYLQPYPRRYGDNQALAIVIKDPAFIKDGQIERALHGAMHVGRSSLLVLVLHQLFQDCFPQYTEKSLATLSATINLDPHRLIELARAAVIYHDSARQNEGFDHWDKDSAVKLQAALSAHGYGQDIARFFESATANKDAPGTFSQDCRTVFPNVEVQSLDYVRKLINLADCFDSIRCRGTFDFQYVIRQLEDLPTYHQQTHLPLFIQLAQKLHTVIWDQGDMYGDCKLVLDGKTFPTERRGAHFVRARKVQFEHAPNAVSAMAVQMMSYPYFHAVLKGEKLLCTHLATVTPAFEPFIHGTQSGALTLLKLMRDRQLPPEFTSPQGLVEHLLAPMTGELSRRGANRKLVDSPLMCFGRLKLSAENSAQYDFEKTLAYATQDSGKQKNVTLLQEKAQTEFKYYLNECRRYGFTYINAMMVYYLRAKQLGVEDHYLLNAQDKELLLNRYRDTIAVYYLILLLEKHLRLNKALMDTLGYKRSDFAREVAEHLTMNVIIDRMAKLAINVKAIYEAPCESNLTRLLPLFALPSASRYAAQPWLVVALDEPQPCEITSDTRYEFSMLTQNQGGWGLESMFLHYIEHYPSSRAVVGMQKHTPQHIENMEQHWLLLARVLTSKSENLLADSICRTLLTKNFPVILLSETEEAINIAQVQTQEFRANRPLLFGKDITLIATDTHKHAAVLRKFLDVQGFTKVGITLFSELAAIKETTEPPKLLHLEATSRLPTLSWLAAKAVVPGTPQSRAGQSLHDQLRLKLEAAHEKHQAAAKESNNEAGQAQAKKAWLKARADFRRVDKWDEFLADAQAYHKTF